MAQFVKNFDCKNENHAMWLKTVGGAMAKSVNGDPVDMMSAVNSNPLQEIQRLTIQWILLMYIFNCV